MAGEVNEWHQDGSDHFITAACDLHVVGLNAVPEYPFKPGGEHGCAGNDWPAAGVLEAVRRLREAILEGLEMYGFFHVGRDAKGALAACSAGYADDTHL